MSVYFPYHFEPYSSFIRTMYRELSKLHERPAVPMSCFVTKHHDPNWSQKINLIAKVRTY